MALRWHSDGTQMAIRGHHLVVLVEGYAIRCRESRRVDECNQLIRHTNERRKRRRIPTLAQGLLVRQMGARQFEPLLMRLSCDAFGMERAE